MILPYVNERSHGRAKVRAASAPVPEAMWTNRCSILQTVEEKGYGMFRKESVARTASAIEQFAGRRGGESRLGKKRTVSRPGQMTNNSRSRQTMNA
jgi:hypothetical protein